MPPPSADSFESRRDSSDRSISESPAHRGGPAESGGISRRSSRLRIFTPGLVFSILFILPAVVLSLNEQDDADARASLPPGARGKLETGGEVVGHLSFDGKKGRLFAGDSRGPGVVSLDIDAKLAFMEIEDAELANGVNAMAVSPDGRYLALATRKNKGVGVWDATTGEHLAWLDPIGWHASALLFTNDGATLIGSGFQGTIRTWDTSSWMARSSGEFPTEGGCTSLALSPDGRTLAAGMADGWLRAWDFESGKPLARHHVDGSFVRCLAFAPDGRTLVSSTQGNRIQFWDTATYEETRRISAPHLQEVRDIQFIDNSDFMVTCHEEPTIRIWDLRTGGLLRALTGHRKSVRSIALSPDGRTLASGDADATIILWDLPLLLGPDYPPRTKSAGE